MHTVLLDTFGRELMTQVRDRAISRIDGLLGGSLKGESAVRIRAKFEAASPTELERARLLAVEAVDSTLHLLLVLLEQERGPEIRMNGIGGTANLRAISDGLAGELYGENGWIARYSAQK